MKVLDARGLSCPEPVIMIQAAMASKEDAYQMIVDNRTACENVTRYAGHQGYQVKVEENDNSIILSTTKAQVIFDKATQLFRIINLENGKTVAEQSDPA